MDKNEVLTEVIEIIWELDRQIQGMPTGTAHNALWRKREALKQVKKCFEENSK